MGIEPTRDCIAAPRTVLKTGEPTRDSSASLSGILSDRLRNVYRFLCRSERFVFGCQKNRATLNPISVVSYAFDPATTLP